jgi:signal transduction histidine kinase
MIGSANNAEARLKLAAFDTARRALLVLDRTGNIVLYNKAAERQLGAEAVQGNILTTLPGLRAVLSARVPAKIAGTGSHLGQIDTKAGPRAFELAELPLDDQTFLLLQLSAEEPLLNELRPSELSTYQLSHDFSNAMTALRYHTSFVKQVLPANDPLASELDIVDEAASQAVGLARQLVLAQRAPTSRCAAALNAGILEVVRLLSRSDNKRTPINVDLDNTVGEVRLLPGQLHQLLSNLVLNALQACSGGGEVVIRTRSIMDLDPPRFELRVEDQGHGIAPEVRDQIFEPFFTTRAVKQAVHGLGLSIVRSMVEQADGCMSIESRKHEGTTVRVLLPTAAPRNSGGPN